MITHLLLIAVLVYVTKRLVELVILIQQWLTRSLKPGPEKPPSGDGSSTAASDNAPAESTPSLPGVYAVHHDLRPGSQRSELMVTATPEVLPEVFLDLVEKMGEQIVLTLGENLPGEKAGQIISFAPLMDSRQLQALLSEFADVINRRQALEVTVHNTEKCCYLALTANKSIVVEACNAAPYIAALQRRGLREVQVGKLEDRRPHAAAPEKGEVPEERLAQLKQRLAISSSYFSAPLWVN